MPAFGTSALSLNTTGSNNTAVGYFGLRRGTGSNNTSLGFMAGGTSTSGITTGSNNTVIGYSVGSTTLSTGSSNILIGTSSAVDTPAAGTSNWLNIGNTVFGDMAGVRVGIGSATINAGASLDLSSRTDSLLLPRVASQRPVTPTVGMVRYNTTSNRC